jgi:hypothetical protein
METFQQQPQRMVKMRLLGFRGIPTGTDGK